MGPKYMFGLNCVIKIDLLGWTLDVSRTIDLA